MLSFNFTFSSKYSLDLLLWENGKPSLYKNTISKKYHLAKIQERLDEWLKSMGGQNAKWRKLSRQNSISIAETFTDKMQNSPPARKTVNKKWSSFSFLLQTEPDEKPNKGINSRRTFLIPFLISNFHCLISVSLNYFFVPSAIVSLNFVLNLCIFFS